MTLNAINTKQGRMHTRYVGEATILKKKGTIILIKEQLTITHNIRPAH